MSNGVMILLMFFAIIIFPICIVFIIIAVNKRNRRKKIDSYKGVTNGKILKITTGGADYPFIIHVSYSVNGVNYELKESAKLKSETIKIGFLPIGQRKTFVLGAVKEGDFVQIHYDESNPRNAIIYGNEGVITG